MTVDKKEVLRKARAADKTFLFPQNTIKFNIRTELMTQSEPIKIYALQCALYNKGEDTNLFSSHLHIPLCFTLISSHINYI